MNRLLKAAAALLCAAGITASASTVTATVTDTDGQAWIGGKWTATLTIPGTVFNPDVPKVAGVPVPVTKNGILDAAGVLSGTFTDTSTLDQTGGKWVFVVCPNVSGSQVCVTVTTTVIGGNVSLTPVFSQLPAPRFPAGIESFGYADSEVLLPPPTGSMYFNVTDKCLHQWNGTIWATCPTGGGGGSGNVLTGTYKAITRYPATGATVGPATQAAVDDSGNVVALSLNGAKNSDLFGSVAAAQGNCVTGNCLIATPPNSADGTPFGALAPLAGQPSSSWEDFRYGSSAFAATNPAPNSQTRGEYQSGNMGAVSFTLPNPGNIQGGQQNAIFQENYFETPGYSNGIVGCPDFCPKAGYTAASNWAVAIERNITDTFNMAGIHGYGGSNVFCYGAGDCQASGYQYPIYMGGFSVPSDEGGYLGPAFLGLTKGDWTGTLTTVVDANHIFATQMANGGTQGQLRFLMDTTQAVLGTDGNPLKQVAVTAIQTPQYNPYGTLSMASAHFPVSTFQGTLASDCTVPIQDSGVAPATCTVNVTSGALNTTGLMCMANNIGDTYAFGAQVLTVPNSTTFTTNLRKSVLAGAYVFQGGLCGTMIDFSADVNNYLGSTIHGSAFMVIGSLNPTTLVYANYVASQAWGIIPNKGTQAAFAAISLTGLTQSGNTVTGTVANGLQGSLTGIYSDILNYARYFTISGCGNSIDGGGDLGLLTAVNGVPTFSYTSSSSGTATCASASFTPQQNTASLYWGAEVFDTTNHAPGILPKNAVDGTFALSYQPNFKVGDTLDMPPHYSMAVEGIHAAMEMDQPNQQNNGISIAMGTKSGEAGNAIEVNSVAIVQEMAGQGGTSYGNNVIDAAGQFRNFFNFAYAPMHGGAVLNIGPEHYGYNNNPYFANFNIWKINGGSAYLNFDMPSSTYTWQFPVAPGGYAFQISPTAVTSNVPAVMKMAQFEATSPTTGLTSPVAQMHECGSLQNHLGAACFDTINTSLPTVTNAGTPGTSTRIYFIAINQLTGGTSNTLYGGTATSNATLNGTNYNIISCSVLPAGTTGEVYAYVNPSFYDIGHCSGPSASVNDTGAGTSLNAGAFASFGAQFNAGNFLANGMGGGFGWSQLNNFNSNGISPLTQAQGISMPTVGTVSFDTGTRGNGAATIKAAGATLTNTVANSQISGWKAGSGGDSTLAAGAANTDQLGYSVSAGNCLAINRNNAGYSCISLGGSGGTTYGTPTIASSVAGVSFPSPNWAKTDHTFTIVATPTATVAASTTIVTVQFGKTWVDGTGTPVYPNCQVTPRLSPSAGLAIWTNGNLGTVGATGSQFLMFTGTTQTLTAGTTYAWVVACEGTEE